MSDVATTAELEALREAAGTPHPPTQLTFEARLAIGGEGPRAYDWSDKPHRIVYDLCREIEKNAAERDRLREALDETAQILSQCTFESIRVHGQYIDRREAVSRARAALKGETP